MVLWSGVELGRWILCLLGLCSARSDCGTADVGASAAKVDAKVVCVDDLPTGVSAAKLFFVSCGDKRVKDPEGRQELLGDPEAAGDLGDPEAVGDLLSDDAEASGDCRDDAEAEGRGDLPGDDV